MALSDIPDEIFTTIGKLLTDHDIQGVMDKIGEVETILTAKAVEVSHVKDSILHLLNFTEDQPPASPEEPINHGG